MFKDVAATIAKVETVFFIFQYLSKPLIAQQVCGGTYF